MCSVDPDELVEMTRSTKELDINSGNVMCRKCNSEVAVVVLRIKDAYCRECFLSYFVHKFRSTIGKSKQIRPGDRVIVATSGGLSSSALLHLVRDGLNETSHKKLRFEPVFLYIDESCLSDNPDKGSEYIQEICSQVTSFNFPCYYTSLEQVMATETTSPVLFSKDNTLEVQEGNSQLISELKTLLQNCKNESARQDLHEQLRRELLYQCASSLQYTKIFLGENATKLSISILANVAVGRGSQIADRVQFKAQHRDIIVYRPMREILLNEVEFYVKTHNILTIDAPSLRLKGSSIAKCTEEFVMGLQKEFPATVPTIFRTGDKLVSTTSDSSKCSTPVPGGEDMSLQERICCALCGLQIDTIQCESSAIHATLLSQKLSRIGAPGQSTPQGKLNDTIESENSEEKSSPSQNSDSNNCCSDKSSNTCGDTEQKTCCKSDIKAQESTELSKEIVEKHLCYGCRIILRELEQVNRLPTKVRGAVAEQERRNQMRDQIEDFLL